MNTAQLVFPREGEEAPSCTVAYHEECDALFIASCLSAREVSQYYARADSKKADWLCGRLAAKRAIQAHIERVSGVTVPYRELEIISRPQQPPVLLIEDTALPHECIPEHIVFSLAHAAGVAIACVESALRYRAVGVDIEPIRTFEESTLRAFLTPREYEAYRGLEATARNAFATQRWCIKEAYLKACGVGLRMHPGRIEVVEKASPDEHITLSVDGAPVCAVVHWTTMNGVYILVCVGI